MAFPDRSPLDPPPATRIAQVDAITFEGRPPNLNSRPGNWQAERRVRDQWLEDDTTTAIAARLEWERKHGQKWTPLRKCRIDITFVVADKRRRDWDNMIAAQKTRFDALVAAGIILDDSTEVIDSLGFDMIVEPKRSYAVFEVSEL